MTEFIKYPHLERFGTDEVDGINIGTCYIFPKIDFKVLNQFAIKRTKELKRELFGG